MTDRDDRYMVPGLVRGLDTLRLFTPERPRLSLAEIARLLGISRSAAFRTVYTLAQTGCLLHDEASQDYALGPEVIRLSYGYFATRELLEIARDELQRLRDRTGWSVHLGVLDGTSALYRVRIPGNTAGPAIVQVGTRLPARATTLGRVLLAGLSDDDLVARFRASAATALPAILRRARVDREAGLVVHTGDFEAGILSAAAPVRDMAGAVVAAVNVTAADTAESERALESRIATELTRSVSTISRRMGWPGSI